MDREQQQQEQKEEEQQQEAEDGSVMETQFVYHKYETIDEARRPQDPLPPTPPSPYDPLPPPPPPPPSVASHVLSEEPAYQIVYDVLSEERLV